MYVGEPSELHTPSRKLALLQGDGIRNFLHLDERAMVNAVLKPNSLNLIHCCAKLRQARRGRVLCLPAHAESASVCSVKSINSYKLGVCQRSVTKQPAYVQAVC